MALFSSILGGVKSGVKKAASAVGGLFSGVNVYNAPSQLGANISSAFTNLHASRANEPAPGTQPRLYPASTPGLSVTRGTSASVYGGGGPVSYSGETSGPAPRNSYQSFNVQPAVTSRTNTASSAALTPQTFPQGSTPSSGSRSSSSSKKSTTSYLSPTDFESRFGRTRSYVDPETGQLYQPTGGFTGLQGDSRLQLPLTSTGSGNYGSFFAGTGAPGATGRSAFTGLLGGVRGGDLFGVPSANAASDEQSTDVTQQQQGGGFVSRYLQPFLQKIIPGDSFTIGQPNNQAFLEQAQSLAGSVYGGQPAPQQSAPQPYGGSFSPTLPSAPFTANTNVVQSSPVFTSAPTFNGGTIEQVIAQGSARVSEITELLKQGKISNPQQYVAELEGISNQLAQARLSLNPSPEEPMLPPPPEAAELPTFDVGTYENLQREFGVPEKLKELEEVEAKIESYEAIIDEARVEIEADPELPARLGAKRIASLEREFGFRIRALQGRQQILTNQVSRAQDEVNKRFGIVRDQFMNEQDNYYRRQDDLRQQLNTFISTGAIAQFSDQDLQQWAEASGLSTSQLKAIRQQVAKNEDLNTRNIESTIASREGNTKVDLDYQRTQANQFIADNGGASYEDLFATLSSRTELPDSVIRALLIDAGKRPVDLSPAGSNPYR